MNEPQTSTSVMEPAPATPVATPTPQTTPSAPTPVAHQVVPTIEQQRYLLGQLLEALPNHRLPVGQANRRMPLSVKKKLGMNPPLANQLRQVLVDQGYIACTGKGQRLIYELTDAGRVHLQELGGPFLARKPDAELADEPLLGYQKAHLLFQLFTAPERKMTRGEANKTRGSRGLHLSPRMANRVRHQLQQEGLIEIDRIGQNESYRLTRAGLQRLATMHFLPSNRPLAITGEELNALLDLVRSELQASNRPTASPMPTDDLRSVILGEFERLCRDHYPHTQQVPIHEIRQHVAQRCGPTQASHEHFDNPLRALAAQGQVALFPLTDPHTVTPDQLAGSLQASDQLYYYVGRPGYSTHV